MNNNDDNNNELDHFERRFFHWNVLHDLWHAMMTTQHTMMIFQRMAFSTSII